jgi:hypothetical protein
LLVFAVAHVSSNSPAADVVTDGALNAVVSAAAFA